MDLPGLLRLAYSAERAAAYAYRGHAASLRDPLLRARIAAIEAEEWAHRAHAARMLRRLEAAPSSWLEVKYAVIGTLIGWSCHVIGRFMPMYFAGRLESGNVNEYLRLAELVRGTVLADETACILHMARVEREHEEFFLARCSGHRLLPAFTRLFGWGEGRSFNPLAAPGPA